MTLNPAIKLQRIAAKTSDIIEMIASRKTKGWAFGEGTDAEKTEKIKAAKQIIFADFENMKRVDFLEKYSIYVSRTNRMFLMEQRPANEALEENKAKQDCAKEIMKRIAVDRINELLKEFPPNQKFYSYTNLTDSKWHRYEELPTSERLEETKAIRWNARLIGMAASRLGSFCVTGIHFDGLVIEFEYVHDEKGLYDPNIR